MRPNYNTAPASCHAFWDRFNCSTTPASCLQLPSFLGWDLIIGMRPNYSTPATTELWKKMHGDSYSSNDPIPFMIVSLFYLHSYLSFFSSFFSFFHFLYSSPSWFLWDWNASFHHLHHRTSLIIQVPPKRSKWRNTRSTYDKVTRIRGVADCGHFNLVTSLLSCSHYWYTIQFNLTDIHHFYRTMSCMIGSDNSSQHWSTH